MRFVSRAAVAALVVLCLAPTAAARPDGPLQPFLEHQDRLVLEWPAYGTVTDGYGYRWGRMHLGLDIGLLRSLDVVAAAPGLVTATGWLPGYEGYGNVVLVDLGEGYSALYAHLTSVHVPVGRWVVRGEQLGQAGCTGSCTGTHLHFELRFRGRSVDPLPWFEPR